jgi:hypothetical protein
MPSSPIAGAHRSRALGRRGPQSAASRGRCHSRRGISADPGRLAHHGSRTRSHLGRSRAPRPVPPWLAARAGPCPHGLRAGRSRHGYRRSPRPRPCAPCPQSGRSQTDSAGQPRGWLHTRPVARARRRSHRGRPPARTARATGPRAVERCESAALRRHIPLPGARQRLVEVVGTEYESTVRGRKSAEVRDVSIAAGLYRDARVWRQREISRHHGGSAAEERERGNKHSSVPDRDELLHTRRPGPPAERQGQTDLELGSSHHEPNEVSYVGPSGHVPRTPPIGVLPESSWSRKHRGDRIECESVAESTRQHVTHTKSCTAEASSLARSR